MSKSTKILGQVIRYKNEIDLSKKLDIGRILKDKQINKTKAIKKVKRQHVIYNADTGDMEKIDLTQKPLLIRQYTDIRRITKPIRDAILTQPVTVLNNELNNDTILIYDNYAKEAVIDPDDLNIRLAYTVNIRIISSFADGTNKQLNKRKITGIYEGYLGEVKYAKHLIYRYGGEIAQIGDDNTRYLYNKYALNDRKIKNRSYMEEAAEINFNDLGDFLQDISEIINRKYGTFCEYVIIDDIITTTVKSNDVFDLQKMRLREVLYDNITVNLFNEIIDINNKNENCVKAYLKKTYKKIDVDTYFSKYDINDGITTEEIIEFCKDNNITCIAYDIKTNVIAKHSIQYKKNQKRQKPLYFIAYNNHLYPLKNKHIQPKINECEKYTQLKQKEINTLFHQICNENIIVKNIKVGSLKSKDDITENDISPINIKSFIHNKIQYFCNDEYDDCKKILQCFGLEDKITFDTTRGNIIKILEEVYNVKIHKSFMPQLKDYRQAGVVYHTDRTDFNEKDIITIDKNKAYGYSLWSLDNIQYTDIRTMNINEKPQEIKPQNAYIVRPKYWSILIPSESIYDGEFLLFCQNENITFDVLYEIECETQQNPYKQLIHDFYTKTQDLKLDDNTIIKDIINFHIGKFEQTENIKRVEYVDKFCNKSEAEKSAIRYLDYDDSRVFCFNQTLYAENIYSNKLLSFQIKNRSRKILYEKMKELELTSNDIIKIKTDEIAFIKKDAVLRNIDNINFKSWKMSEYNLIKDNFDNIQHEQIHNFNNISLSNNHLYEALAGSGKTHFIVNNVLPKLIEDKKKYIVLSPSHSCIKDYKKNGFNCNVIQKYALTGQLPEEDIIIIDEIGLCDKQANDIIYKCHLLGKQIISYGDYNQLLPVEPLNANPRHYNNEIYLNLLYRVRGTFKNNYRNNFSSSYYNQLINGELDLTEEIKKHCTKTYKDCEYVICHTNELCKKYNDLILKHKNISYDDIGSKVMCKTNKYGITHGIYNNFIYTITDKDDDNITLDNNIKITSSQFYAKLTKDKLAFVPAYARTHYNIQGESISSFFVPNESLQFFNSAREAYTIISRKKEIVDIKPKVEKSTETPIKKNKVFINEIPKIF